MTKNILSAFIHRRRAFVAGTVTIAMLVVSGLANLCLAGEPVTAGVATASVPAYLKGYEQIYAQNPREAGRQWFRGAKFGLFVHYALASLMEGGKWEFDEFVENNEPPAGTTARPEQQLLKRFTAENFDADAICRLALAAEMRYVTFTTIHLGRMYMFRTGVTDFTSLNSPAKRDLVAEMAEACRRHGLGLFFYVPPEVARTDPEHIQRNHTMLRELLTQYGPIAGIWFDGIGDYRKTPQNYTRLAETYALVRSLQPQSLISFKEGALGTEDFVTPEHFLFVDPVKEIPWDTAGRAERWNIRLQRKNRDPESLTKFKHLLREINTTMQECNNRDAVGQPGGWINDETARHLTADEVMFLLRIARSQDANLLVNIGPRGDGSIHPQDAKVLREVGRRIKRGGFPEP